MLRKTTLIALATATLWSMVLPQSALAWCGFGPCYGYGTYAPRPFYDGNLYPDPYIRAYAYAYGFGVGCYLTRRPVLGLSGWQTRTVQVCD
jgi:hypothetical protein